MKKIKVIYNTNYGIDKVPDYIKENIQLKELESSLIDEDKLEKFLLDNIRL